MAVVVIHLRSGAVSGKARDWMDRVNERYDEATLELVKECFELHGSVDMEILLATLTGIAQSLAIMVKACAATMEDRQVAEEAMLDAVSAEAKRVLSRLAHLR